MKRTRQASLDLSEARVDPITLIGPDHNFAGVQEDFLGSQRHGVK